PRAATASCSSRGRCARRSPVRCRFPSSAEPEPKPGNFPDPAAYSPAENARMETTAAMLVFFVVTFVFSWLPWLGAIASSRGWIPFPVPLTPFGSFGPALGAFFALAFFGEPGALRRWLASIGRWRVPAWTLIVAVALPPAAAVASFFGAAAFR